MHFKWVRVHNKIENPIKDEQRECVWTVLWTRVPCMFHVFMMQFSDFIHIHPNSKWIYLLPFFQDKNSSFKWKLFGMKTVFKWSSTQEKTKQKWFSLKSQIGLAWRQTAIYIHTNTRKDKVRRKWRCCKLDCFFILFSFSLRTINKASINLWYVLLQCTSLHCFVRPTSEIYNELNFVRW